MNEFETRINALRLQYRAERVQITKDCYRAVGHINQAIGMTPHSEVREALRAERDRVRQASRRSMCSKQAYRQQLEILNDQYRLHLDRNPSGRAARRAMSTLNRYAEAMGVKALNLAFRSDRRAEVKFA